MNVSVLQVARFYCYLGPDASAAAACPHVPIEGERWAYEELAMPLNSTVAAAVTAGTDGTTVATAITASTITSATGATTVADKVADLPVNTINGTITTPGSRKAIMDATLPVTTTTTITAITGSPVKSRVKKVSHKKRGTVVDSNRASLPKVVLALGLGARVWVHYDKATYSGTVVGHDHADSEYRIKYDGSSSEWVHASRVKPGAFFESRRRKRREVDMYQS